MNTTTSSCIDSGATIKVGKILFNNPASPGEGALVILHPARIMMILSAVTFIVFTQRIIKHNQTLRRKINAHKLFAVQLLLHPILIGGCVGFANVTGNEWWGLLALPFIFNFGAEPMDLSKLPQNVYVKFQMFCYIHHAGPLLASLRCFAIVHDRRFAMANALLYAHAWSLHTINSLDYRKILNKQQIFWPYMCQAFLVFTYWWKSIQLGLDDGFALTSLLPLFIGFLFQYGGRWGLYEYIRYFMGYPGPDDKRFDAFETRKQLGEITAFIFGAAIAFARR